MEVSKLNCLLMSDIKNEQSLERLKIMTGTTDGFEIADADLKLRGPGDFFGERSNREHLFLKWQI